MNCVGSPVSWLIGASTIIYLATGVYLWRYLRTRHPSVWQWMDSPIISRPTPLALKASVYICWFAFSLKPEKLHDPKLSAIVWAFRIELAVILMPIVLGELLGWLSPSCTVIAP